MENYKTDFTYDEIYNSINKLIKNYRSIFYETKYETIHSFNTSHLCLYCNSICKDIKYTISTNLIDIGNFCSIICRDIFYSIISNIFIFPHVLIKFLPFNMLTLESQYIFIQLKEILENISLKKIIINSTFYSNYFICFIKIFINFNDIWTFTIKFNYINNSDKCLYCCQQVDKSLILPTKYCTISGFCSTICRDSVSKFTYYSLIPKYKYYTYLVPFNMLYKEDILQLIQKLKYEKYLYGGFISYNCDSMKIEFYTPK